MRKVALALTVVLAIGMMAGCSNVPEWVRKGSGAFPGDHGSALYAVGIASPDPNAALQRNMARMDARTELARSMKSYVAELIKNFMQKHQDMFDKEHASSVQFYQQAGKQVTEATLYGTKEADTWIDKDGEMGGEAGTMYVLMIHPLDNEFFDTAKKEYESLMRRHQVKLLKVETDKALKELDVELKKAQEGAPFGLSGEISLPPEEK